MMIIIESKQSEVTKHEDDVLLSTSSWLQPHSTFSLCHQPPPSRPKPLPPPPPPPPADFIRSVCNVTEDAADVSYSSISRYPNVINQNLNKLCCVDLALAQSEARRVATYVSGLKGRFSSDCNFTLGVAIDQLSDSLGTIRRIAAGKGGVFKSAMEMAAALTNQDTCMDEFLEELVTEVKTFTGIALEFVDYYSKKGSP